MDTVNYLVGTITAKGIHLELKRLPIVLAGGRMPQTTANQPREFVRISDEAKKRGFAPAGTMVIDKTDKERVFRDRTGEFANPYNAPRPKPGGKRPPREPRAVAKADGKQIAERQAALRERLAVGEKLVAYLDCGVQRRVETAGVGVELAQGRPFVYEIGKQIAGILPSHRTLCFDEKETEKQP